MTKLKIISCVFTLLILVIMVLSGCSNSKMNQRTFDKIENGMTLSEVDKIMGFDDTGNWPWQISNDILRLVIYGVKNEPASTFIVSYAIVKKEQEIQEIKVKFDEEKVISKECKGI